MHRLFVKYREILIWLAYFSLLLSFAYNNWGSVQSGIEVAFFMVAVHAVIFYTTYYLLIPRTLKKQHYLGFTLVSIVFIMICFVVTFFVFKTAFDNGYWIAPEYTRDLTSAIYPSVERLWTARVGFSGVNVFAISVLYFFAQRDEERKQQLLALEHEKTSAELKLLQMQINPHFLFNALNNIYAEAVLEESSVANSIHHLSGLLRYTIYECDTDRISLIKEIKYLDNYIDLQKGKVGDLDAIELRVEGAITEVQIVPMVLIAFVENAFKHGNIARGGWIKIMVRVQDGCLEFICANSMAEKTQVKDEASGVGLMNVQKRLALNYPDKHELLIDEQNSQYKVTLRIKY